MVAPKMLAKGAGNINFNSSTINYKIRLQHKNASGITIPLTISGTLQHPKYIPDYASIATQIIGKEVKKNVIQKIFNGKNAGNLKDKFKNLFH